MECLTAVEAASTIARVTGTRGLGPADRSTNLELRTRWEEKPMTATTGMKTGALGGPTTFAGTAAVKLRELYPELGELTYFPTVDEVWSAFDKGQVDGIVFPSETTRTGFNEPMLRRIAAPDARAYVIAEMVVAYAASLLAKPGTRLEDIRRVLGHGMSTAQSRPWLTQHLPQAEIIIHGVNSVAAAQEVAATDDLTVACVGTPETAKRTGLVELAQNIDGGTAANFWAVASSPRFSETPERAIIVGRFQGTGELNDLITALAGIGYRLNTACCYHAGTGLFEYDYVLRFTGSGKRAEVERAVSKVAAARLAGAFDVRG